MVEEMEGTKRKVDEDIKTMLQAVKLMGKKYKGVRTLYTCRSKKLRS